MTEGGLIGFTLGRRITVLMMAAAVLLVGLISYFLVPLELAPKGFAEDAVSVWIPVSSSNPVEVQEQIIRPAEEEIRTIAGVKEIQSRAGPNRASLEVTFSRDVNVDLAVAELRDRLERARTSWPADVRQFRIFRFNLDTDLPVCAFAIDLTSGYSDEIAFLIEEKVIKELEAVPGIARVVCWGLLQDQVRVRVNREKAESMGIRIYDLTQTLTNSNLELSGGEIEHGDTRYVLRTDARFRSVDEIRNFPVNPDGVRLGDIATVEPVKAVRDRMALSRNQQSLWCQVMKESSANAVDVSDRVSQYLDRLQGNQRLAALGGEVRPYPRMDMGLMITGALDTLRSTAATGAILAVIVLFYFLRRLAPTLLITTAIPFSLLITLGWLYFSGGSLNILSMLGITVSIGMLIDNAIVVVENIFRFRDLGFGPIESARKGAAEVALAITLSTLTTVAAFLPIIFMSGNDQLSFFTAAIGLPLCAAVLSSLVVALVFVPLGTVLFTKSRPTRNTDGVGAPNRRSVVEAVRDWYGSTLDRVLVNRLATVLIVVTAVTALSTLAWQKLPKADVMSDSGGQIAIRVNLEDNFSLNDAYSEMKFFGNWLEEHITEYGIEHFWCWFDKRSGRFWVTLDHQDMEQTRLVAEQLRKNLPERAGVKLGFSIEDGSSEEKGENKLVLELHGPDAQVLGTLADDLLPRLESVEGVLSAESDLEQGEEEIHIIPSRSLSSRHDLDPRALRGTLEYGVRGWWFSDLVVDDQEIPLIIEYDGAAERTFAELQELAIPAGDGTTVPLSSVAEIKVSRGLGEIRRKNGQTSATLTLDVGGRTTDAVARDLAQLLGSYQLPEGYSFTETRREGLDKAMGEMAAAVALAVVFVFLLMGILFESFILPMAVLVAVPFSWAGAVWSLSLTSTPFDFVGAIGVIVLVGIVVNNGIVLIDCAHRLMTDGHSRRAALVEAGRTRFRPIMMTALTTVVGLIPMALSDGGGSQISYKALSRALIGGLVVSTFFTLYFVPILYTLFDDVRRGASRIVSAGIPAGLVSGKSSVSGEF